METRNSYAKVQIWIINAWHVNYDFRAKNVSYNILSLEKLAFLVKREWDINICLQAIIEFVWKVVCYASLDLIDLPDGWNKVAQLECHKLAAEKRTKTKGYGDLVKI